MALCGEFEEAVDLSKERVWNTGLAQSVSYPHTAIWEDAC